MRAPEPPSGCRYHDAARDHAVLAPHIASASHETRLRMATMAAEDALAALEGRRPTQPVNPTVLEG